MPSICARSLLVDGRMTGPATVHLNGGRVERVGPADPAADTVLDSGVLTPGLIDLQTNGAFGHDFAGSNTDGWLTVAGRLPGTGVTAFLPTLITGDLDRLVGSLHHAHTVRQAADSTPGARVLGAHLEGPFLSPARPGTHPVRYLREPRPELVGQLLDDSRVREVLTLVTLAPELPGALEAVRRFAAAGVVVSLGHTDATAAQVGAAASAGARMVTHVFNAQRGLGHREPGVVGAALTDPRLSIGLIADLHHVAPPVCSLVLAAAGQRTALVTDAMAAAGMPPGRYRLGDVTVVHTDGDAPRNLDGTIAGSALTLDAAVRNLVGLGHDPALVLSCASAVPAGLLDRPTLGRIGPGANADLVWWSSDLRPLRTWVGGRVVFDVGSPGEEHPGLAGPVGPDL